MQEKLIVSLDKVSEIRKAAGQSPEKIKRAAQEFTSIPESGKFSHIGTKVFTINDKDYTSVGLYLENGKFISENALYQQNLLEEFTQIKNGKRQGLFMLKSDRLSNLDRFGDSQDIRLHALQGKAFKTEVNSEIRVYKSEYLDAIRFDDVCFEKDTKTNINNALACTETKKGYIFTIED